jgi:hypothetical protein
VAGGSAAAPPGAVRAVGHRGADAAPVLADLRGAGLQRAQIGGTVAGALAVDRTTATVALAALFLVLFLLLGLVLAATLGLELIPLLVGIPIPIAVPILVAVFLALVPFAGGGLCGAAAEDGPQQGAEDGAPAAGFAEQPCQVVEAQWIHGTPSSDDLAAVVPFAHPTPAGTPRTLTTP